MHHVVLPKYNAAFTDVLTDADRNVATPWLDSRFQLFVDGPLRSMRLQDRRPDQWLLFLDARTPTAQLDALLDAVGDDAELVLIAGHLTDTRVAQEVGARLPKGTRQLVMTRLDSDDALGVDMLRRVQEVAPSYEGFLNPALGLQISGRAVLLRWDRSSAFMSYVERVEPSQPVTTVFCIEHYLARSVAPVRRLPGINYVQVIHGGNLSNQLEGIQVPRRWASGRVGFDPVGADATAGPRPTPAALARAAARMVYRELVSAVRGR